MNKEIQESILNRKDADKTIDENDIKKAISKVLLNLDAHAKQVESNTNSLSIACKANPSPNSKSVAQFEEKSGVITFFTRPDASGTSDQLLDPTRHEQVFLHEFVHMSLVQPQFCSSSNSEIYANSISAVCWMNVNTNGGGTSKVPDVFVNEDVSKKEHAVVAAATEKRITGAIDEIPTQQIDLKTQAYVVDKLPETSVAGADVEQAVQSTFAPAMESFTRPLDTIAGLLIPPAEAQSVQLIQASAQTISHDDNSTSSSYSTVQNAQNVQDVYVQSSSRQDSRQIAVEYSPPLGAPALKVVQAEATVSATQAAQSRAPASSGLSSASSVVPTNLAGSNFSRDLQQTEIRENGINPGNHRQVYTVAGILFTDKSVTGAQYRAYQAKMNQEPASFSRLLSNQGILISKMVRT